MDAPTLSRDKKNSDKHTDRWTNANINALHKIVTFYSER